MKDIVFTVTHLKFLNKDVFELKLTAPEPLPECRAGQFINLKVADASLCLRRPFCLYKFDKTSVTLIIEIVGKGTRLLAQLKKGDTVTGVMPLGNGFIVEKQHQNIALISGGIGCAPLLAVPLTHPNKNVCAYLGFSDKSKTVLVDEFKKACRVKVSTDDGSYGFNGYATDAFLDDFNSGVFKPDVLLTCGCEPLLKAVQQISRQLKIPAYMTGETRMGCGVGACLVCACAVHEGGKTVQKRACADGPVFLIEDVVL
ncbi:MAG: dihydroorotate dehydrogenase electron transfer subunit [Firmicutes bacterium]|nr:dihydroorotate dehydrogenase electron transfer subunit [Bacillota bacterium]